MKIIKLFVLAVITALMLTSCNQKEEVIKYNLTSICPNHPEILDEYKTSENDENHYGSFSVGELLEELTDEKISEIKSLTIYEEEYSDEVCAQIIEKCSKVNIPVFFLGGTVDLDIISQYDKAFSVTLDYTYLGELYATKINQMWKTQIADRNGDQIFTFSVIKPENISNDLILFNDSLLKNIELLGMPMEKLDEATGTPEEILIYCKDNKYNNEAYIIIDSTCLSAISEGYPPVGEGVEILGIESGFSNNFSADPTIEVCFVNYADYFVAKDKILSNIEMKNYPFENFDYTYINKTVFLRPEI